MLAVKTYLFKYNLEMTQYLQESFLNEKPYNFYFLHANSKANKKKNIFFILFFS